MDVAITGTTLLTMRGGGLGIVDDGALGVDDGEIAYVGPAEGFDADADLVVDGSNRLTMPGLVDAHAHTGLTILRGGAQDVPEIEWMTRALGPLAAHLEPEDRIAGSRLGVLEAVRSGATTVAEYAGEVAELIESVHRPVGVRAVAVETINEVVDRSGGPDEPYGFDRSAGEAGLARANDLVDAYGDDPLVTPAYGPQALDMVSAELLETVREEARGRDRRIHMHVAQGRRERLQVEARYGADATAVSVLDDLGLLAPPRGFVAVHCHGTTPGERGRLTDAGVPMVACPSSIAAIDGIVPPIEDYRGRGGVVGIGTDQAPGPGGHDALREVRTASLLSKVDRGDPTALPAHEALRLATVEGAWALGLDGRIGTLEVGKRADVITVALDRPAMAPAVAEPFHTTVANLVYSASGAEVVDVFVDGEPVVRDGGFVEADEAAAAEEATERATALFERAADDWRAAGSELVGHADAGRL